jgi:hypothetical protein
MDGYGYKRVMKGGKERKKKYASCRSLKGKKKSGSIHFELRPRDEGVAG